MLKHTDGTPKLCAVIGAGIAGLTAAAALRSMNCSVHVYEQNSASLLVQSRASHRLVHPTISRWPSEDLKLTTEFKFLDWCASTSDAIINHLRNDWGRLSSSARNGELELVNNVRVDELICQKNKVLLKCDDKKRSAPLPKGFQPRGGYDLVIVATGFGEQHAPGLDSVSYWSGDQIDAWRVGKKEAVVSGCGDGGLIDALRLVHAHFDRGWLAIRLAYRLGQEFRHEIEDAEEQALRDERSIASMYFDRSAGNPPSIDLVSNGESEKVVQNLSRLYLSIVERMPTHARDLLDRSIEEAGVPVGQVKLVAPLSQPFSVFSAPIHKIMIAHAIHADAIAYVQGKVRHRNGAVEILRTATNDSAPLGGQVGLVVRHASSVNLESLLEPAERNTLRLRQLLLADYIDTETPRPMTPPPGYPAWEGPSRTEFIKSRYAIAAELISSLSPDAALTATIDGFFCEVVASPSSTEPLADIPLPQSLFRIPLSVSAPARFKAL
jgi:hypothetical protein